MTQPGPQRQPTDVVDVLDRIGRSLDRIERGMKILRWMLFVLAVTLMAKLAFL